MCGLSMVGIQQILTTIPPLSKDATGKYLIPLEKKTENSSEMKEDYLTVQGIMRV